MSNVNSNKYFPKKGEFFFIKSTIGKLDLLLCLENANGVIAYIKATSTVKSRCRSNNFYGWSFAKEDGTLTAKSKKILSS